jgi:hypothetical protein
MSHKDVAKRLAVAMAIVDKPWRQYLQLLIDARQEVLQGYPNASNREVDEYFKKQIIVCGCASSMLL